MEQIIKTKDDTQHGRSWMLLDIRKSFQYPAVIDNHFKYRHAVDDHNAKRHSPISTAWWPNSCFAFLLAVTKVNVKLAYKYFFHGEVITLHNGWFSKKMAYALIHNSYLDNGTVGRPNRVLRPLLVSHQKMRVDQYKIWRGDRFVNCKTWFSQW